MNTKPVSLLSASKLTATNTGAAVEVGDYHGLAQVVLNASLMEAASTSAVVKLQHADTSSGSYTDAGIAFAAITDTDGKFQALGINADRLKKFVRVVSTLTGTTPAVTVSVTLVGATEQP
jgi:hypothetical protein